MDVLVSPACGMSGTSERQLEKIVSSTCEACILTSLHPHTAISITLQIEHNAGAVSQYLAVIVVMPC